MIGYYLFDENPYYGGMTPSIWKNVAQEMKKIDGSKFYFANWNRIGYQGECGEEVQTLSEVDQLSSADVYPIKCNGGEAVDIYNTFKPWYNNCFNTNQVPLMPILQGFGSVSRENCGEGEGDWIIPSENDLRRQVYYSITGGATGFWYFLFHSGRHCTINQFSRWDSCKSEEWCGLNQHANPAGWEAAKKINQEIQVYERELLSPTVWQGYEVWGEGEKLGVKSVFKAPANQPGVIYLLTVAARNGAIRVSAPKQIVKVESLLASGKVINLQSGKNYFQTNSGGRNGDRIDFFRITLAGAGPTLTPVVTKIPTLTPTLIPTTTKIPTSTKTPSLTPTKLPTSTMTPIPTIIKLRGDANGDARVDLNDASIWRSEFIQGDMGTVIKNGWWADFDNDRKITLNDISIWRENFIKTL